AALRALLPEATVGVLYAYPDALLHIKNGSLEANGPYIVGTDEFYPVTTAQSLARGRCFTFIEVEHHALVTVLGAEVREALFPNEDPIGKDITIEGLRYRVSGVLEKKGAQFGFSPDNKVAVPYAAFERQFA